MAQLGNFSAPQMPKLALSTPTARDSAIASQSAQEVDLARQKREQELESKVPGIPEAPATGQKFDPKQHIALFGAMMFLSMLAGKRTGEPMTAAMNNMTASLKGYQQGNMMAQQQQEKQMIDNFNAAMAAHKQGLEEYKLDLEKLYKDPKYGQQAVYMKMLERGMKPEIAAMYSDPVNAPRLYEANLRATEHAMDAFTKMGYGPYAAQINDKKRASMTPAQQRGAQMGISQEAVDIEAWKYINTGQLTYRKGTGGGRDLNTIILDRVGELARELGMSPQELSMKPASYKADASSLAFMTKKADNQQAAFSSLENNFDQMEAAAKGLPGRYSEVQATFHAIDFSDVTSFDRLKFKLDQATNDPDVVRYITSVMFVAADVARIKQGSASTASLTVGVQQEAAHIINVGYNDAARKGLKDSIINDSRGQMDGVNSQITAIKNRMAGIGEHPSGSKTTEDDEAMAWAKANPNDPRAQQIIKIHGG